MTLQALPGGFYSVIAPGAHRLQTPQAGSAQLDAVNEASIMIGRVITSDGGSHTIDTTGSSSLGWRSAGLTFANAGTTVKVGLAAVLMTAGPPGRAAHASDVITFDVSKSLTGGGGLITANAWQTHVPDTGTKTIANGDLVAFAVQMTARGGADIVRPSYGSGLGNAFHRPIVTNFLGGSYANASGIPTCVITFSDGALGYFHSGDVASAYSTRTWNSGSATKEYGQLYNLPFPYNVYGIYGIFNGGNDCDLVLYSDPLGTPVAEKTVSFDANTAPFSGGAFISELFASPYSVPASTNIAVCWKPGGSDVDAYYKTMASATHRVSDVWGTSGYGVSRASGAFANANSSLDHYYIGLIVGAFDDGASAGGGMLRHPGMTGASLAKHEVKTGMTDYTVLVFIPDSASTDGSGKTGLVAANLTVSGVRVETDNDVTVTDYTSSLNNLAALTTAHTDWGLLEVSNTLAPGLYRLDIADAIFASGAWSAVVYVMVTTSAAAASPMEFILVPDAPITGVNVSQWNGTAVSSPATAGIPDVNVKNIDNDAASASGTVTFPNATLASTTNITAGTLTTVTTATNVTTVNGLAANVITAASMAADASGEIADAVWDEDATGHQTGGTFGQAIGDPGADTDTIWGIVNAIGATGTGLTAIPWNAAWDAEVQSEVDDALIAKGLDHLVFTSVTGTDIADNSIIARLASKSATADWDSYDNTTDSHEAIRDKETDIETDTAEIGAAGAGLTNINLPNQTMDIIGSITGNITGNLSGSVGSVTGAVGSVTGAVGSVGAGGITAASFAANAITAAKLDPDVTTELQAGLATAAALATVDGIVDDILLDTAEIGAAGAGLTNINLPNQTMDIIGNITGNLSGSVGSVTGLTTATIADQVWEETLADHSGTVGSTAAALNAAGSAGDPWNTALPGAYGAGTAGKIIGDNINATVSSRASQASVDTVDTVVDAVKVQTDKLTFTVANQLDANIQYVNDVQVNGVGTAGSPWSP